MGIVYACAVPHPPLIVPAVGRGEEAAIQETTDAYLQVAREVLEANPDLIVVTSPHAPFLRNAFHVTTEAMLWGSMAQFRAPGCCIEARCDTAFAEAVAAALAASGVQVVTSAQYQGDMDHGTFVPLYFVREAYRELAGKDRPLGQDLPCPIVRIGLSTLSAETHRELGRIIARVAGAQGKRVAFIASGDLSHKLKADGPYGFVPEGPVFDEQICEIFAGGDLEGLFTMDEQMCDAAAECGLRSFQIMAGALEGLAYDAECLSHQGTFGVGYGVAAFRVAESATAPQVVTASEEAAASQVEVTSEEAAVSQTGTASEEGVDPYVALARLSVETYVRTGRAATLPDDMPDELLATRAGAFVSLHEYGMLRGCIGTIGPTCENVAMEIIRNGISACSRDPRFNAVGVDELDNLEYSVDVLAPAEPIDSIDYLDPIRYGVIVTKGLRRGLLLPNLDGVDTAEQQVAIAKQKAGISVNDDAVDLERFEVVRHTKGGEPRCS